MIADRDAVWSTALDDLRRIAVFVLALNALLAVIMGLLRNGMPGLSELVSVFAAISTLAITAPFHAGRLFSTPRLHLQLFGPLIVAAGLVALALTYLGRIGAWSIIVLAAISAAPIIWQVARGASIRRAPLWLGLLILSALLLGLDFAGTKYSSFFADELALFGRTDGDQFYQGALVASLANFGLPSMAIDGLQPMHYHFGFNWITARVSAAVPGDPIAAVVASKIFLFVPLIWFVVALAAGIWRAALLPQLRVAPLAAVGSIALFILLATYVDVGNIVYESESMLAGAALGLLLFPGVLLLALDRDASRSWRMIAVVICSLGLWPLAACKISMGFVFAGVFGISMLLVHGLRRAELWVGGVLSVLAFGTALLMFNDPGSEGAEWLGRIHYFEYGFDRGNWLLPVAAHVETILALLFLWGLWGELNPWRRQALCALLAGAAVANIPVLLLRIEGGDALYFLYAQAWLATTINVALFPRLWAVSARYLRTIRPWLPAGLATLLLVGLIAQGASYATGRFNSFVSASALLRTGDRSYYADDKKRVWREDRKRALQEIGLAKLLTGSPAQPDGAALAERLRALRAEFGTSAAVFVPAENEAYWEMARDCDAKSLFPIAVAGLPQVLGYYAKQETCRQDAAWFGFPPPPAEPALHQTEEAVCRRALETGFQTVIWVDSLAAEDVRVVPCERS
ncbi:hypothetical protein [Dongia deserti]|uniref:hypothetical protein n=1 Tax=Dongia deserti TaxID=2268030 RepID=UPI000E651F12|nr:hypothetical protein [Dongia deserti]